MAGLPIPYEAEELPEHLTEAVLFIITNDSDVKEIDGVSHFDELREQIDTAGPYGHENLLQWYQHDPVGASRAIEAAHDATKISLGHDPDKLNPAMVEPQNLGL